MDEKKVTIIDDKITKGKRVSRYDLCAYKTNVKEQNLNIQDKVE